MSAVCVFHERRAGDASEGRAAAYALTIANTPIPSGGPIGQSHPREFRSLLMKDKKQARRQLRGMYSDSVFCSEQEYVLSSLKALAHWLQYGSFVRPRLPVGQSTQPAPRSWKRIATARELH